MKKGIVLNQKVNSKKIIRSRELRKEMTESEKIFWSVVRNRGVNNYKFRRQQIIDGFIVDFYCDELDLVVEIDGPVHNQKEQKDRDGERDKILMQRGLKILRITNDDVMMNMDKIVKNICEYKRALD